MRPDPLEAALTEQTQARLTAGDWTVIGIAAGGALAAAVNFLKSFDLEPDGAGLVVIVCRMEKR